MATHAAMFATVATHTHPRYRPNVPSVTRRSSQLPERVPTSRTRIRTRTARSRTITTTLAVTLPNCTAQIHAALSRAEAAAHGRSETCRAVRRGDGSS
ncbi:hypothetical protein [Nesterenkonia pannonica]|uniref:hypothetical protein n=1 Tax=Nesterenkonia pannonica TaxID=1548602 RepID=UPI002164A21F|nr:hypothetical protein [Nesterenkonia pannonica]